MTTPTGKPRGTCPECGRSIMLLADDRIGKHGLKTPKGQKQVWPPQNCPGWGKAAEGTA
jgi:hypothetical protein